MKFYSEIEAWMYANGYEMSKSESGYYYCVHTNEEGTSNVVWMDSACEDAYDLESATLVAYSIITEEK